MTLVEQKSILDAAIEGKEIEQLPKIDSSSFIWVPKAHNVEFNFARYDYRIKPKPQYKPYSKVDESWIGKAVRTKSNENSLHIVTDVYLKYNTVVVGRRTLGAIEFCTLYNQLSGEPFGEEVK